MPIDRNGWVASESLDVAPLVVDGESFTPGVLNHRDAFTLLQYVAVQMNARVERIYAPGWHEADDWGYAYRENRNDPNSLSRHAFALAIDYNATRHPNGVPASHTFTFAQITEIRKIVNECGGAVQWGGDFNGTPDAMHFQIDASKSLVAEAAARIRNNVEEEMKEEDFARIREIVGEVVENKINNPDFILKVANRTKAQVWTKPIEVVNAEGQTVKREAGDLQAATFEKVTKLVAGN